MPFHFVSGDLTTMSTDAIVNAANHRLAPGGGVCGAIFAAAGYDKLHHACRQIGGCPTGEAVLTDGFDLPARFIIHTVGPVWQGGTRQEPELLKSCYQNSLQTAKKHGCASIAFPLISAGIFGYPKLDALQIAVSAIQDFLKTSEMDVFLVIFEHRAVLLPEPLKQKIQAFLDSTWIDNHTRLNELPFGIQQLAETAPQSPEEALETLEEPFSVTFSRMIDQKHLTASEVCHRANMHQALFAKLQEPGFNPSRTTALALAAALQLSLAETSAFLQHAGYALSHSSRADVIFEYFIRENQTDIFQINAALFTFGQKQLGA